MTGFSLAKRILGRSLRGRCPRCGQGRIRERGFHYRNDCEACGYHFVRDSVDLGMFLYVSTAAITGVFVIGYLIIGFPTTGWYRLLIGAMGLAVMIGTAPFRRYMAIGTMYLAHLLFDEPDQETRILDHE